MSIYLDANSDPFSRAVDLINPIKTVTVHGDVEIVETYHPPQSHPAGDSPLMIAALARAAEAGREHRASKFYVDRRLPWLIALEAHLAGATQ
jgi:hypothetical protein